MIGAIQAVVLTGALNRLLDLSAGQTTALALCAVLTSASFVAVNHALVSTLGGLGRLVSVAVAVAAAGGALTTAAPHTFGAIAPFLPLTPALQGVRAVVSGGSGGPAAMGLLLAWLLLAVSISVLAVARQRTLPAAMSTVRQIVAGSPGS